MLVAVLSEELGKKYFLVLPNSHILVSIIFRLVSNGNGFLP